MAMAKTSTRMLLERWHAGDKEALDSLIAMELPWLRSRVRQRMGALLRQKGETDDYVQEALIRLLRYGPRFLISGEEHFRALAARLIENVLRDESDRLTALRRAAEKERRLSTDIILDLDSPRNTPQDPSPRPSQVAQREEREAWVRLALELLEPEDREVLLLHEFEALTFARLGERLGISEDAARMRYNRALPRLAAKMKGLRREGFTALELADGG